jgi:hypothetical protein
MQKGITIGLLQLLLCSTLFSQELLREELVPIVQIFINSFMNNNKNEIVKQIGYPFYLGVNDGLNIKAIDNETEMLNKFELVFDQKLIDEIANSSAQDDWRSLGWRGIYFLK